MEHRHLTHRQYTLAAIDDIISRGRRQDWIALRDAIRTSPPLAEKVLAVCAAHTSDQYAQRYHFWDHYVRSRAV
ncbi:MAG: hypothetical protein AB1634_11715 [Thermodesulfobacteriota bacterium]